MEDKEFKFSFQSCLEIYEILAEKVLNSNEKIYVLTRASQEFAIGFFPANTIANTPQLKMAAAENLACALEVKGLRYSYSWRQHISTLLNQLKRCLIEKTQGDDKSKYALTVQVFEQKAQDFIDICMKEQLISERVRLSSIRKTVDEIESSCLFMYTRPESNPLVILMPIQEDTFNIDTGKFKSSNVWEKLRTLNNSGEDIRTDIMLLQKIEDLCLTYQLSNLIKFIPEVKKKANEQRTGRTENSRKKNNTKTFSEVQAIIEPAEVSHLYEKLAMKSVTSNNTEDQERIVSELLDEISYKDFSEESLSTIQTKTIELNKCLEQSFALSGEIAKLEALGKGKSGEVSRFFHTSLRKFLAEKSVLPRDNSDMKYDKAMIQEMKNLLKVRKENSQNLLQVYKIEYEPNRSLKLLMEYGIGTLQDVFDYIKDAKIVYPELAEDIKKAIQSQLRYLRDHDILYTDIHAQNVIIREDSSFIFCDYEAAISMVIGADESVAELTKRLESDAEGYVNIYEKESKEIFFAKFRADRVWQIYRRLDSESARDNIDRLLLDLVLPEELKIRLHKELEEINQEQKRVPLTEEQKNDLWRQKFYCLNMLGQAYLSLGDSVNSSRCFEEAKLWPLKIHPDLIPAFMDISIGHIYYGLMRPEDALKHYLQINVILEKFSRYSFNEKQKDILKDHEAFTLLGIGKCHRMLGKREQAKKCFLNSKEIFDSLKKEKDSLHVDLQLAALEANIDKIKSHVKLCKSNYQLVSEYGLECYFEKVKAYVLMDNQSKFNKSSEKLLEIAIDLYGKTHTQIVCIQQVISRMKEVMTLKQDYRKYKQQESIAKSQNEPLHHGIIRCYVELIRIHLKLNEVKEANEYINKLAELAQKSNEAKCALIFALEGKKDEELKVLMKKMQNIKDALQTKDQLRIDILNFERYIYKAEARMLLGEKDEFQRSYKKIKKLQTNLYSNNDNAHKEEINNLESLLKELYVKAGNKGFL